MSDTFETQVLERVTAAWGENIRKETYNGIKLQEIDDGIDDNSLKRAIEELVRSRKLDVISSSTQLNPHIKRFPTLPVPRQLETLNIAEKYHTCLYPTPEFVQENIDLSALREKPFSKALASAAEQLQPKFFELGVLAVCGKTFARARIC